MDLQLAGKVALVTGASVGIGRGIARVLAAEGCRLALLARRRPLLEAVAAELPASAAPLVVAEDLTDPDAAPRIRDAVLGRFGRCDILVNNAGGSRGQPPGELGAEDVWQEAMELNFHAARRLTHALVPAMRAQGFGRIVNVTGPDEPLAMNPANAPNGATHIWAKALSRELARDGVTVNSIPPGIIRSEQIDQRVLPTEEARRARAEQVPAGYLGQPEDLAVLVAFLASPLARYITGQVVHVDGGARRASA
ncbi:SDR family NAD(P)-dependent oxidoreductase [Paracraurococcus ruber]|uniref:3-oxoacyl-ACP reductase n=1 Tax=Paracraurococcus ruber TaxID=77675 RepID=A0ABS1CYC9_9PROT|nr:SDR family oxidoreductase [Paracraurococcus ruber]MBK1658714.1 3-oxoacyl-ACP reductase [Paracraurococcus ruber]TDG30058.1 SDR family oxidoreductase [Paracraurococcus ruber]